MRPHGRFTHCSCKMLHFYTCSASTARFSLLYRNILLLHRYELKMFSQSVGVFFYFCKMLFFFILINNILSRIGERNLPWKYDTQVFISLINKFWSRQYNDNITLWGLVWFFWSIELPRRNSSEFGRAFFCSLVDIYIFVNNANFFHFLKVSIKHV